MELSARSAYRGQVTKIVKNATDFLDSEGSQLNSTNDLDVIEEDIVQFIQRLTSAHESLNAVNKDVQTKGLFKTDDLDRELERISEYEDSAIGALSRLNSRLQKVRNKLNPKENFPTQPTLNMSSSHHPNHNYSIKLPKLELKKFDGNYQDWLLFWEQFRTAVHENGNLTSSDKFSYLESVLTGSAKKVIAGFTASGMCYEAAISLLQEQFGDVERLVDKNMQRLLSLRPVNQRTDAAGLRNLYNSITSCCRTLTALQIPTHHYYVMLKTILLRCLPAELRVDYYRVIEREERIAETNEDDASSTTSLQIGDKQVKDIMRFLKREVESLERSIVVSSLPSSSSNTRHSSSYHTTASSLVSLNEKNVCAFCSSEKHLTKNCDCQLSITEKREMLRKSGRCFRCANRGHSSKKCRSAKWLPCTNCRSKHLTSLCDPSFAGQRNSTSEKIDKTQPKAVNLCAGNSVVMSEESMQSATNLCAYNNCLNNTNVFLKTARGIAVSPNTNKSFLLRLIIDGGSQYSYIREDLMQKLNLSCVGEVNFSLIPFGCGQQNPSSKFKKVNVELKSQFDNKRIILEAVVVPQICIDVLSAPDTSCTFLKDLQLADSCHADVEAVNGLGMLIGSDHYWSVVSGKQKRISSGLRAVETIFGWTLQGSHSTAIGIRGEEEENEHLADELIQQCISKNGQRYQASLPWKNPDIEVKSNREEALSRLKSLSTWLSRYPEQYQQYDAGIQQLLQDGVAEPIPPSNNNDLPRVIYLPHRPVYKAESTTTKMRIVFDASARTEHSPSLNDLLHVGANLLPDVLKILLNFRLGRYGIVADVERAFLQIELNVKDRDSHRFLWYASTNNTEREIVEYRMTRVTFGVNCSPFLLTATLRLHLKNETQFQPTCKILMDSFYMDDFAASCDTEEEGKRICEEAVLVMKNASMNLRKWNSNSELVRSALCPGESTINQKVLGLSWYVRSDEIAVPLDSLQNLLTSNLVKGTKRNVLQAIARIYDPLGMLGPVVVRLKILFQCIWREKLSWDEALTPDLMVLWDDCVKNLHQLKDFAIPRAVLCFSVANKINIHIFADASMKAYGTVAFIKSINDDGEEGVSFLCAKNRVAPLKTDGIKELSLPKLELTAALLAARLCAYLKQSLTADVHKFYLWTDSKIALGWIQGDAHRWKPYVQSRVVEIRHLTSIADWRHCKGNENPADLLTRGVTAHNLLNSSIWTHGPTWLKGDLNFNDEESVSGFKDLAPVALLAPVSVLNETSPEPLLPYSNFSSWKGLLRRTAFIIRAVGLYKLKKNLDVLAKPPFVFAELSATEIEAAELYWLRYLQKLSFSNEILYLQKEKSVPKTSKIAQLCPFLDENGLMRLKGRLESLNAPLNQKHPIILPKSYIVKLIIDDCHQRTCHGGTNVVLCKLREQFWILKGRPFIKARIKNCIVCQKLFSKPVSQPFGPLPIERITMSRPFDCVGVDFAGPLFYLDGFSNQMNKSYLMVFTCAAIRSIHLEVVTNMSTECCLMGLRRFIARRGAPTTIYSDNAKSFRRAALELTNTSHVPDDGLVQNFLTNRRIRWKFIVERAPWWGGFWERLIRSIKNILKVVIGRAKLTFEQLRTVISEAEEMVNIRPLTYVSSDPLDISPFTPAHFIHGQGGLVNSKNLVTSSDMQQLWVQRLKITNVLWYRWRTEYLQLLRSFHHSQGYSSDQLKSNDVVLVFDSAKPRIAWKLAVVEAAFTGRDGKVRACEIRYADGSRTRRPVQLLYHLELASLPRAEDVKNY